MRCANELLKTSRPDLKCLHKLNRDTHKILHSLPRSILKVKVKNNEIGDYDASNANNKGNDLTFKEKNLSKICYQWTKALYRI